LTMSASATNYVYLDTSASCAPAAKTTTFTASDIPIAEVVAGTSSITSISDVRTPFVTPGSGSGGSGTVTDGSGTATANQIATSTSTPHQIQYGTALPSGTTATTQTTGDNTTKVATDAFVLANSTGSGSNALPAYGTLVNQTNWTSLTNYTADGATPTVTAGALVFTGGAGSFNESLNWTSTNNYSTTLPQFTEQMTATVQGGNGIGIGVRSTAYLGASASYGIVCRMDGSSGNVYINEAAGGAQLAIAGPLAFTAGDSVQFTLPRDYGLFASSVRDITTSSAPMTATYTYSFTYPQSNISPNLGQFAIFNFGGTQTVTAFSVTSNSPVGATVAYVGDSKTVGYYQGASSFPIIGQGNTSALTLAGGGDTTYDVLANLPEIIALKPKNVILNIGRNDYCLGSVSLATVESNYASIVSQLTTAGINVLNLQPLYETSCNQATFTTWVSTNYGSTYISTANLSSYPGSYVVAADGIHPTVNAAILINQDIVNYFQANSSLNAFLYLTNAASGAAIVPVSGGGMFSGSLSLTPSLTSTGLNTAWNTTGTYSAANVSSGILFEDTTSYGGGNYWEGTLGSYPSAPFTVSTLLSIPFIYNNYAEIGLAIANTLTGQAMVFSLQGSGAAPTLIVYGTA